MLIGLISDTHIGFPSEKLPPQIKDAFRDVELILHAGDIWIPSALNELEAIAPTIAAWGDDDMRTDLGDDKRMLKGNIILLDSITLWLKHIKPRPELFNQKTQALISHPEKPEDRRPDAIIFGHTHSATIENYEGILWVNPGSATLPNYIPKLGTVALLSTDSGKIEARIVQLE